MIHRCYELTLFLCSCAYSNPSDKDCGVALNISKISSFTEYILNHVMFCNIRLYTVCIGHYVEKNELNCKTWRFARNKSVEYPGKCFYLFSFSFFHVFGDLIHEHDMLDSGQVWELMSWNRSRDLVFTIASGSHIKDSVCLQLCSSYRVLLQGLSESQLVMNEAYTEL